MCCCVGNFVPLVAAQYSVVLRVARTSGLVTPQCSCWSLRSMSAEGCPLRRPSRLNFDSFGDRRRIFTLNAKVSDRNVHFDTFGASRKFRILAVNDDCCRENLCLMADTSISGARVARELDALVRIYTKPTCIVSDNGRSLPVARS